MNKISITAAVFSFIFISSSSAQSQNLDPVPELLSGRQQTNEQVGNQTRVELQDPDASELQDQNKALLAFVTLKIMETKEKIRSEMDRFEQENARRGTLLEVVADHWKLVAGHAVFTVGGLIAARVIRNNLMARGVLPLAPATERALRWISYAVSVPVTGYAGYVVYSAMTDDTVEQLKKNAF